MAKSALEQHLTDLGKLRDKGLITDDEYNQRRALLISSTDGTASSGPSYQPVIDYYPEEATVFVQRDESVGFAVFTLVLYLLVVTSPLAAVLNVVGFFTGPRRGCFLAMMVVFMVPFGLLAAALASGSVSDPR